MNNYITANGLRWYSGLVWSSRNMDIVCVTVLSPNKRLGIYTDFQADAHDVTKLTANYRRTSTHYLIEASEENLSYAELDPVVSKVIKSIPNSYPYWASLEDIHEWRKILELL